MIGTKGVLTKHQDYIISDPILSQRRSNTVDISKPPRVSFCIPTLNNENILEKCLKSIAGQKYPDKEIIVIDGYSKDGTLKIAEKYADKVVFDKGTYGSACQTGIDNATGQIIGLFDSDTEMPHDRWLINAIEYFNYGEKVSTVWPLQAPSPQSTVTTRFYLEHWNMILADRISRNRGLFGGGNGLFLTMALNEIGGIDRKIHWGADFDWAQKLKDSCYQVVLIKDPIYHHTMTSFKQFARKQFVGADTFMETGFEMMGLSDWDIFREQFVIGTIGMVRGLLQERDSSWLLFFPFLGTKMMAYSYVLAVKSTKNRSKEGKTIRSM